MWSRTFSTARAPLHNATCASAKSRSPPPLPCEVAVSGPPPDCVARFLPFTTGGLGSTPAVHSDRPSPGQKRFIIVPARLISEADGPSDRPSAPRACPRDGEKPVARMVMLALEGRICAEWRPRENETEPAMRAAGRRQPDLRIRLGCITQPRRRVRRPPAYRSSPGRE